MSQSKVMSTRTLGQDLSQILESGIDSDLTFAVGPTRHLINAHSLILKSRSPIFSTMFHHRWQDAKSDRDNRTILDISYTDVETFKRFLQFVYTDELTKMSSVDEGLELFKLSHMYQVQNLSSRCSDFLKRKINVTTCVKIYLTSKLYYKMDLNQEVCKFIQRNVAEILSGDQLFEFDEASMAELLKSDELEINELELFKALLRWIERESVCQKDVKMALLNLIRYPLMGEEAFAFQVVPTKMLSDDLIRNIFGYFDGEIKAKELLVPYVSRRFENKGWASISMSKLSSVQCCYQSMVSSYDMSPDKHLSYVKMGEGLNSTYQIQDSPFLVPQFKFKCDKNIKLHGLMFYGIQELPPGYLGYTYVVNFKIWDSENADLLSLEERKWGNKGVTQVGNFAVQLDNPVKIDADKWYWISAGRLTALISPISGQNNTHGRTNWKRQRMSTENEITSKCSYGFSRVPPYASSFSKFQSIHRFDFDYECKKKDELRTIGIIHSILFNRHV